MRELLRQVADGQGQFRPEGHDPEALQHFQITAARLISAEKRGYLGKVVPHKATADGKTRFDLVVIIEGLTLEGERFITRSGDDPQPPFFRLRPATNVMPKEELSTKTTKLVFVSHSSADEDLADKLVDLLCTALHMRRGEFLCTSVDGSRLQGGDDTEDVLRDRIREVPAFLSLLTPQALTSAYVLFELGARWGCEKPHIPLLAKGAGPAVLKEPLKAKNALRVSEEADVYQLVEQLGSALRLSPEPTSSYSAKVRAVISVSLKGEDQGITRKAAVRLQGCIELMKSASSFEIGLAQIRGFQKSCDQSQEEVVVISDDKIVSHANAAIVDQPATNGWPDQRSSGNSPYLSMKTERRGMRIVQVVGHGERRTALAFEQLDNPPCMIVAEAHRHP